MIQPGTLQPWEVGEAVRADKLNQPVDVLRRMRSVGPARQVIGHPIPDVAASGETGKFRLAHDDELAEAQLPVMQADWFYAVRVDVERSDPVRVAKPHKLRTTPWHNRVVYIDELRRLPLPEPGEPGEEPPAPGTFVRYDYQDSRAHEYNRRTAVQIRDPDDPDAPRIPYIPSLEFIWPPYAKAALQDAGTTEEVMSAIRIGDGRGGTDIDGVEWEEASDSGRVWSMKVFVFDDLVVTPYDDQRSTGPEGGPFSPRCITYELLSRGSGRVVDWTAAGTQDWLGATPEAGTLYPGDFVTVDVCINANAELLTAGSHENAITFTNTGSRYEHIRGVSLEVLP